MEKLEDVEYYYFRFRNRDGWIISLHRVMYGTRVVIYHRDDKLSINGSFCGGDNPELVEALYKKLYKWLATNPEDVKGDCRVLHANEHVRPFGKDEKFMQLISNLPSEGESPEHDAFQFLMKPITP